MTKIEKTISIINRLPKEERERVKQAFFRIKKHRAHLGEWDALGALCDVVIAWERSQRKKAQSLESDHRTRRTLGARVPIDLYERAKHDAESRGVSLYRWILSAYEMALVLPWMD